MTEQRSRRAFLTALGGAGGLLGGCTTLSTGRTRNTVSLLVAGSLNDALENDFRKRLDHPVRIEAHGSAQVARLVAEGQKAPDIVSLADEALFDGPLHPRWYATFATNAVVLAYDATSRGGRRLANADRWYEPLLDGDVRLGRTDPDLDPLGYRTLFVLDLASDVYDGTPDLRATIPARKQVYPETQLISQFETGSIDAAFTYRSMAVSRGYDYVTLPATINLSDPSKAQAYARTGYTLPDGKHVQGAPIRYVATARDDRDAVSQVFDRHVNGAYLSAFGFGVPDNYPEVTGDAPATFRP